MNEPRLLKMACVVLGYCLAAAAASAATTTFTTLVNLNETNGATPNAGLVQATDGNLYGTTYAGGAHNAGTVFKITSGGTLITVYSFCTQTGCTDGASPYAGLIQGPDGNLYGTTVFGGTKNKGTVFKLTFGGTLTTLYSFCIQTGCSDGELPYSQLMQDSSGNFYGTTQMGGPFKRGAAFKLTPAGTLTVIHSFDVTEGEFPYAGMLPEPDGLYYFGSTPEGGINSSACQNGSCGILYKMSPTGALTLLHSFDGTDGDAPYAGLAQGTDFSWYGTTYGGGANNNCTFGCGTIFKFTVLGHVMATLYSFSGYPTDGARPEAKLVQATDGSFYGTTQMGGADCPSNGCGTVFKVTPKGVLTTLHSFNGTDGDSPYGGLLQATDGKFYGTTSTGGTSNACTGGCGTIFSLSVGLAPFVELPTNTGKVGASIIILGTNLTSATGVKFNGTPATFTVVSSSEMSATVPAGATTGKVQVTTASSTLNSNVAFHVTPQVLSFTPTSGAVGTTVQINGVSLTQTAVVTFGGVKATTFTVNSDTQVTATVPTGAKTGRVAVSSPGGTATSPSNFTVTP